MYGVKLSNYKENEVLGAAPEKLVLMLYEGAVNFLKRLDDMDYSKNIETKSYNINKAYDILSSLSGSLDMQYKEISDPLFSLYTYMQKLLVQANMDNDPTKVAQVIKMIAELKDSWQQAICKVATEKVSSQTEVFADPDQLEKSSFSMVG